MRFVLRAVNSLMAIPSKPPPLPPTPSTPEGEKSGWVIIYRPAVCATRSLARLALVSSVSSWWLDRARLSGSASSFRARLFIITLVAVSAISVNGDSSPV